MKTLTYLETLFPTALEHLKELVGINSFTANPPGIRANGEKLAEIFRELDFRAEFVASENPDYGDHLFLSGGAVERTPICLVSHLDTVYPPEEEIKQDFVWQDDAASGRIYGPGTVDIKGGTIVIWMLLKAIRELEPALFQTHRWLVALNASEEVRCEDFERLVKARAGNHAKAVLVFEGGVETPKHKLLVTARKGRRELSIHAVGRGAHAGSAIQEGRNAVVALSKFVASVADLARHFEELTINLATLHGGTVNNRVPHEATLGLEMRAFKEAVLDDAVQTLERIAHDIALATEVEFHFTESGRSPSWAGDEGTMALFLHWQNVGAAMGFEVQFSKRGGMSDANYLHQLGPTLDGLGPFGDDAHNSQRDPARGITPEWVMKPTLLTKTHWNFEALVQWLKGRSQ